MATVETPLVPASPPSGRDAAVRPWIGLGIGLVLVLSALVLGLQPTFRLPTSIGAVPVGGGGDAVGSARASPGGIDAAPERLEIASVDISAPITPAGVAAGQLEVPEDAAVVGWWKDGARPGSEQGTVVLAGHVDTREQGPGALYRLENAAPGERLVVTTAAGGVSYRVVARRTYHKEALPQDLFASGGSPRLAVITCGGAFDSSTGHYEENVVIYGVPAI